MDRVLPRLRRDLDVMPSPLAEQPGILLRDPFRYTDHIVVIPPVWVAVLPCLDGGHTLLDAQAVMTRLAGGHIVAGSEIGNFVSALDEAGFLEGDALDAMKARRHEEFRKASVREATHAGSAYPATSDAIEATFSERLEGAGGDGARWPVAIAAPHVSPEGGFASYAAAYDLPTLDGDETPTFVVLGTSHYGVPETFGTTAKPFRTPLGDVAIDENALSRFVSRAGDAVVEEDYCHRSEHSIELQVVVLQYRLRRPFRILPILCGPFVDSLVSKKPPESLDGNRRVFDALAELHAQRSDVVWVLGVDMAHVGRRYGDDATVRANEGAMVEVGERDRKRLERVCANDAEGYFELMHPNGDELNWCGYSPIYTFLRSVGSAMKVKGELRSYEQWNIDAASVVTFGAVHFFEQ